MFCFRLQPGAAAVLKSPPCAASRLLPPSPLRQSPLRVANDRYLIVAGAGHPRRTDRRPPRRANSAPLVEVLYSEADPGYAMFNALKDEVTATASWKPPGARARRPTCTGLPPPSPCRLPPGEAEAPIASATSFPPVPSSRWRWSVDLPRGREAPVLELELVPRAAGLLSVGLAALAPRLTPIRNSFFSHWSGSGRRFPAFLPDPRTFRQHAGRVAHPRRGDRGAGRRSPRNPYRFATAENSRFGILLREATGAAGPPCSRPSSAGPNRAAHPANATVSAPGTSWLPAAGTAASRTCSARSSATAASAATPPIRSTRRSRT